MEPGTEGATLAACSLVLRVGRQLVRWKGGNKLAGWHGVWIDGFSIALLVFFPLSVFCVGWYKTKVRGSFAFPSGFPGWLVGGVNCWS